MSMSLVTQFLANAFVLDLGWFLLHVLWEGTLVALGLAALLALIDGRSASIRYGLSTLALGLMLVLPLLTAFVELPGTVPVSLGNTGVSAEVPSGAIASAASTPSLLARVVVFLSAWAPWFVPVWLCGVCFLTIRTFGGWFAARQLTKVGLLDVPEPVQRSFKSLKRRFGITGDVIFRQSNRAEVPAVIGYFRPVLLMPVSALSGMPLAQIEAVLAHELAHIKRHDYLVNVFQQIAEILLFFHPAAWWVSNQIRCEREHCCDDLAVLACGDVLTYSSALVTLEEQRGSARVLRGALAATHGSLRDRVRRLLGRSEWQPGTRTALVPVVLATMCLTLAIATAYAQGGAQTSDRLPAAASANDPAKEMIALFDVTTDRKMRQEMISVMSGSTAPEIWTRLIAIAESDPDLEVRKTAISYLSGRPNVDTLASLYDKADRREMKLYLLSYIHGLQNEASRAKIRAIAKSDPDSVVRIAALDYLSGR